jgi:nesprin-1
MLFFDSPKNILTKHIFHSLSNTLNGKYIQIKKILEILKDLASNCANIDTELDKIEKDLTAFDPFYKEIDQNQQIINQINNKLTNYKSEIQKISKSLSDFKEYIAPENCDQLKNLELRVEKLLDVMEEKDRQFKIAKTIRNDYTYNIEKVNCWIVETEEKLKGHYTEPVEFKISLHNLCQDKPKVTEWYDTANKSGLSIVESTHDEKEIRNINANLEQTKEKMDQVFNLLDEQKEIIDNVVDAWSKFMELYQIIINWANEKKIFVAQELKFNKIQEAQLKLNEYAVSENYKLGFFKFSKFFYDIFFRRH